VGWQQKEGIARRGSMARRMVDVEFRNQPWLHRYDGHIAANNMLVGELRNDADDGLMPCMTPPAK